MSVPLSPNTGNPAIEDIIKEIQGDLDSRWPIPPRMGSTEIKDDVWQRSVKATGMDLVAFNDLWDAMNPALREWFRWYGTHYARMALVRSDARIVDVTPGG